MMYVLHLVCQVRNETKTWIISENQKYCTTTCRGWKVTIKSRLQYKKHNKCSPCVKLRYYKSFTFSIVSQYFSNFDRFCLQLFDKLWGGLISFKVWTTKNYLSSVKPLSFQRTTHILFNLRSCHLNYFTQIN